MVPMIITIQSEHMPPSTNGLFANVAGKGRVRSKRYREWANAAGWDMNGKGTIPGPYSLSLILSRKKRRKGQDLSNLVKAIEDLMVTHKIVEDDSLAERITLEWGDCDGFYAEVRPFFVPL